jgi:hypothetical protein
MVTQQQLADVLGASGQSPIALQQADGGSALILPHGGRIIGLFVRPGGESCFWVNPRLAAPESAPQVLTSTVWVNTGGDRIWVGPEVDTHLGDLNDPWSSYLVPRDVDPGVYTAVRMEDTVHLRLLATVPLYRQHSTCQVEISRSIRLVANPLRHEPVVSAWLNQVDYVGYEQSTTLNILRPSEESAAIDIWSIVMLPASGWMIVPTLGPVAVRDYMQPPAPEYVRHGPHAVLLRIDGERRYKIGLRATSLAGRAGYLRQNGDDRWTLVVRNFQVNPSGEYIDPPWDNVAEWGYAFQAYNDDGGYGRFGELEYHSPGIGGNSGEVSRCDVSQVWAFEGSQEHICVLTDLLLGDGVLSTLASLWSE